MRLRSVTIDDLAVDDERSFRHVALYDELKAVLRRDRAQFLVPEPGARDARWDRVLFLNLTFWSAEEPVELLTEARIPADVVMHAAWHHLTRRALPREAPSADAMFLGEAIASAFDLYLIGRLLGHAPDSDFLETQVSAIADAAEAAGLAEDAFERLLDDVAREPDRAFEDLRALLFDAATSLVGCGSVHDAARALEAIDEHRLAPLVHHYELSNWILYARAYAAPREASSAVRFAPDPAVRAVDAALRAEAASGRSALEWLEKSWLAGSGTA